MTTIPNIITFGRLALLLPMTGLFYIGGAWATWLLLIIYILGAASDYLDGYIARKYKQTSPFGEFLDPLSDKIYVSVIMVLLIATDRVGTLGVFLILLILIREFVISGLREYLGAKNIKLPVIDLAKWKTASQMTALGLLILSPLNPLFQVIGLIMLLAATGLTVVTGTLYMRDGLRHL